MRRIFFSIIIFCSAFSGLFCCQNYARAAGATLFISPASGSYSVGDTFTATVMVNSGGGSGINAAEGEIKFDPTILKVDGVSTGGSIFSLWVIGNGKGYDFSNSAGKINFGGGSPGAYKGGAGIIVSINFSVLKAGEANLTFSTGLVLANDGLGTNILSSMSPAKFTLKEKAVVQTPPPAEVKKPDKPVEKKAEETGILPPAPEVISTTHPKENIWYANNKPEFKWKLLADVVGVSVSITDASSSDPGTDSEGIVESKAFDNIKNGVWYVHAKFKNKFGWSQITNRRFQVDIEPPADFKIQVNNQEDPTNPTPIIGFETKDAVSGVDHYGLILNNESKEVPARNFKTEPFVSPVLPPGEQTISIIAFDKAGNTASSSLKFIVEPLKMPIITDIPKQLTLGKDDLIIRGNSFYPQTTIQIFIAKPGKDPETSEVKTDAEGNWSFFSNSDKKFSQGNYEIWAKLVDGRGAQSYPTSKYVLVVTKPGIMQAYGLLIVAILLIIALAQLLIIIYLRHKFAEERERIRKETNETRDTVTKVFNALKEELDEQMELADTKKGLSEAERRVKERIQEALEVAQEFIEKEITDTEKEIKIKIKEK